MKRDCILPFLLILHSSQFYAFNYSISVLTIGAVSEAAVIDRNYAKNQTIKVKLRVCLTMPVSIANVTYQNDMESIIAKYISLPSLNNCGSNLGHKSKANLMSSKLFNCPPITPPPPEMLALFQ